MAAAQKSGSGLAPGLRKRNGSQDFDDDLEWLLLSGAVAMRERGTIAGVINALECGGPSEGGSLDESGAYIHPFTDQQLGTGRCVKGEIEKFRWLMSAWLACSENTRGKLMLRHMAPRAAFRSDEGFGAKDRYVEGSDGKCGTHKPTRTGVESHLAELAAVALAVYDKPAELLLACHNHTGDASKVGPTSSGKQAGYGRTIRRARKVAEEALAPCWAEWFESKARADPMRLPRERRAVLPEYEPSGATE